MSSFHFWATVCKTVRPMLSDVCPLSVCDVGVLCSNGWTDQDETWYARRPRPWPHCIICGPSSPSPKGHSPQIFGPCLLWPNGWMDQGGTWHGGRPQPRRLCVRWGPAPSQKGAEPPNFLVDTRLLWPNGCMDQVATGYGFRPWPMRHCVRW